MPRTPGARRDALAEPYDPPLLMPSIPLIDLRAQYHAIKPEIDRAIHAVLERGQFILGPEVEALERELAAYCGTAHAVAVASGTDALELALRACGIGAGDEVITSAFGFFATAEAIISVGAVPVFVDVEPQTYTLDPDAVEAALSPRVKAILPVHLYGHPCAMAEILALAKARRLSVIEDCAQAIGARDQNQRVGSFGDAGAFSFYPTKNLGAYGDAGMVVTNDPGMAERLRLLRVHGSRQRYQHLVVGRNSRLDEVQAAVLRVKLRYLDQWTEARRRHASRYTDLIAAAGLTHIVPPQERPGAFHVYHLYTIRVADRDRLQQLLAQAGIETQVAYPSTLPTQPALASSPIRTGPLPVASAVVGEVLSLPIYPELSPPLIERVVETVARVCCTHPLGEEGEQDPRIHNPR